MAQDVCEGTPDSNRVGYSQGWISAGRIVEMMDGSTRQISVPPPSCRQAHSSHGPFQTVPTTWRPGSPPSLAIRTPSSTFIRRAAVRKGMHASCSAADAHLCRTVPRTTGLHLVKSPDLSPHTIPAARDAGKRGNGERERERERESVCVCVCVLYSVHTVHTKGWCDICACIQPHVIVIPPYPVEIRPSAGKENARAPVRQAVPFAPVCPIPKSHILVPSPGRSFNWFLSLSLACVLPKLSVKCGWLWLPLLLPWPQLLLRSDMVHSLEKVVALPSVAAVHPCLSHSAATKRRGRYHHPRPR
ncbi:hypothetical protein K437DRAFT_148809 [Tilletiaria anomala UBC 951]|uniref:Uncharacterized protein n=1 Tax=Tilletiaria anomala (strain ATCC 24038 / CBS 436.72 / UBC 951) TaxID=1037660 RepID=A0A066WQB2_TILAU|nr:uncharacterized protein K437DRAFT_148809 [Tilletiaria anomala UBC 951]KDN52810.1 hypothetical protein K437DRAFT_148809 [Tilletiaria anomala UBC 951]